MHQMVFQDCSEPMDACKMISYFFLVSSLIKHILFLMYIIPQTTILLAIVRNNTKIVKP